MQGFQRPRGFIKPPKGPSCPLELNAPTGNLQPIQNLLEP